MDNLLLSEQTTNQLIKEIEEGLLSRHRFTEGKISGKELLRFAPHKQINNFILFQVYQDWNAHIQKFRHPYFNFDHPDVVEGMNRFLNTVSRHILIPEAHFRPMLEKAIYNTLNLILKPRELFAKFFFMSHEQIPLELFKKHSPYFADYDFIIQSILKYYDKNQIRVVEKQVFFEKMDRVIDIFESREGNSIEKYRRYLFNRATGRDLDLILEREKGTIPNPPQKAETPPPPVVPPSTPEEKPLSLAEKLAQAKAKQEKGKNERHDFATLDQQKRSFSQPAKPQSEDQSANRPKSVAERLAEAEKRHRQQQEQEREQQENQEEVQAEESAGVEESVKRDEEKPLSLAEKLAQQNKSESFAERMARKQQEQEGEQQENREEEREQQAQESEQQEEEVQAEESAGVEEPVKRDEERPLSLAEKLAQQNKSESFAERMARQQQEQEREQQENREEEREQQEQQQQEEEVQAEESAQVEEPVKRDEERPLSLAEKLAQQNKTESFAERKARQQQEQEGEQQEEEVQAEENAGVEEPVKRDEERPLSLAEKLAQQNKTESFAERMARKQQEQEGEQQENREEEREQQAQESEQQEEEVQAEESAGVEEPVKSDEDVDAADIAAGMIFGEPEKAPEKTEPVREKPSSFAFDLFSSPEPKEEEPRTLAQSFQQDSQPSGVNDSFQSGREIKIDQIPVHKQFQFVQKLFGGENVKFRVVLDKLNATKTWLEAEGLMEKYIFFPGGARQKDKLSQEFILLVKNRFQ